MLVSLNLVKKYVDLPEDLTPQQIAYDLTMRTVEVEDVINTADKFHDIVVGEIKSVSAHPNADALRICMVDCGVGEDKQIVCGGSNLVAGHKVCVSKPGAVVYWHGEGDPVEIKESKLRGEPSYGMICGATEVFLADYFPTEDDHEIVDFTQYGVECEVGQCVAEVVGAADIILEIDNKSLTNRPDMWGHYGVARELAAIYKLPFKALPADKPEGLAKYDVQIDAPAQCPRYSATKIENVCVKESPVWMKTLITNAGMRPINAIVDITNFVMIAVGQPLHAFDSTHVEGEKIVVRSAKAGEKLLLLDDLDLELAEGDLVICDTKEPMALAGIKGGKKDSILDDTTSVLLEAATFTAPGIRKTSRRFDEKTDASMRYEKGIDTERVDIGLRMALDLFQEIFPECKISAFGDAYPEATKNAEIDVTQEFLDIRLGKVLTQAEIEDILTRLGFEVTFTNGVYHCIAPTWRSTGDVSMRDDVLGDIARLLGYEYFESKPLPVNFEHAVKQPDKELGRALREYLAFRCGFNEIFTYPWIEEKYIAAAGIDKETCVKLATPPSPETAYLRASLIPGALEAIEKNKRYYDNFSIFEAAQVFEKGEYHPSSEDETLPIHKNMLTGAIVGDDAKTLFFQVKGVIEGIPGYCHCEGLPFVDCKEAKFVQEEKPSWADEKVWLNIVFNKEVVGSIGLLSVQALSDAGIKRANAAAFEINTDKLVALPSRTNEFKHLPQFPLVDKDLSILVDESVKWADIYEAVKYMVKEVKFVEEYRGEQVPEGKKSIMLSVKIGNDDSTMNAKQIDKKMSGIMKVLGNKVGAELR